jgi:hypothetical protein
LLLSIALLSSISACNAVDWLESAGWALINRLEGLSDGCID